MKGTDQSASSSLSMCRIVLLSLLSPPSFSSSPLLMKETLIISLHKQTRPRFLSPANQRVTDSLIDQVYTDSSGLYSVKEIKRAVHRYYESRRRLGIEEVNRNAILHKSVKCTANTLIMIQALPPILPPSPASLLPFLPSSYLPQLPDRQEKAAEQRKKRKYRARQQRSYDRRKKFVRDGEMQYWDHITPACMTEESDSENGEKIITHDLLWRSECESVENCTQTHNIHDMYTHTCPPIESIHTHTHTPVSPPHPPIAVLNQFIQKLDSRYEKSKKPGTNSTVKRERLQGLPSTSQPSPTLPSWMINPDYKGLNTSATAGTSQSSSMCLEPSAEEVSAAGTYVNVCVCVQELCILGS